MAKTKRIFREWQHPRDAKGRFAEKGTAKWAARAFKAAESAGVGGFSMAHGGGTQERMPSFTRTFGGKKAAPDALAAVGKYVDDKLATRKPSTTRGRVTPSAKNRAIEGTMPKRPDGSPITGGDHVKVKSSGQVLKVSRRDTQHGQQGYQLMTRNDQDHQNTTFYPANLVEHAPAPSAANGDTPEMAKLREQISRARHEGASNRADQLQARLGRLKAQQAIPKGEARTPRTISREAKGTAISRERALSALGPKREYPPTREESPALTQHGVNAGMTGGLPGGKTLRQRREEELQRIAAETRKVDTPRDSGQAGGMSSTTPSKEDAKAVLASIEHLKRPNAKRGDLVAVETTDSTYSVSEGRKESTSVQIGIVESVNKDGKVKTWKSSEDGGERVVGRRDKTYKLEKERVDVAAALAAAQANPWPHDPSKTGKPFDSLAEAQASIRPFLGDQTEKLKAAAAVAPKGRDPMRLQPGDRVQIPQGMPGREPLHAEVTGEPQAYDNGRYDNGVRVPMRLVDGPNAGKEGLHTYRKSEKAQVIPPGVVAREKLGAAMTHHLNKMKEGLDQLGKEIDDAKAARGQESGRGDSTSDLEIGKQLSDISSVKPDYATHEAARVAAREKATAEVDRQLGVSSMGGYDIRNKLTSAEGNKAAMQSQLVERQAALTEARKLHSQIGSADYRDLQHRESIKPLEFQVETLQARVAQHEGEADRARVQLHEAVRRGGADLQRRLNEDAQTKISGVVRSGGYGSHEGADLMRKIDSAPDRKAAIRALTSLEQMGLSNETDRISAHSTNNAKIWRAALKGVDMANVTPEQRDKWTAATEGSFSDINRTLAARERRDLALSRLDVLGKHDPGDDDRERTHLETAIQQERAGLAAAQAELAGLEPKYAAGLDRIRGAINDVRASQGLKAAKIDEKKIAAGYAKRLESQKITPQENPPTSAPSAMQRVSDTIAAQRGLTPEGPAADALRAPNARGEATLGANATPAQIEQIEGQANPYRSMPRTNVLHLARQAGIPIKGRSNNDIADDLHRKDKGEKYARVAALNPGSVGEASSQHETHYDPTTAALSDQQLRNGLIMHGSESATGKKVIAEMRRREMTVGDDGGMARQQKLNDGVAELRAKMAEQQASKASAPREQSMRDLYAQHAGMSRAQFDALPADERERVLADLRKVRDANEGSIRGIRTPGFTGSKGWVAEEHTRGAQNKLQELTRVLPNKDDYTVEGRARRAKAGDPNAIDGTKEELQAIASANGWGYIGSWDKRKQTEYLKDRATAGEHFPTGNLTPEVIADALRGADQRRARAALDALEAIRGLTVADMNGVARALGGKLPGGPKSAKMHSLSVLARDARPKAEAVREAAPETPKAPTVWIDKATGREVTNPGQVGIVRGDIVKADSDAGKAAVAAREARRSANLDKAREVQRGMTREQLLASTDPKDNGAKIRAMQAGNLDRAVLYKTANAGPSGQRTHTVVGRIEHTPENSNGEYRVRGRDGETIGWISSTNRNGKPVYSVHSQNANDEQRLEGWSGELSTAADVLTNGEFVARGYGADARRASSGTFERYAGRNMSLDELELHAARDNLRKAKENAARENLAPYARRSADREVEVRQRQLDELEAERRGEPVGGQQAETPKAPEAPVDAKAAKIAAKEAELEAAKQRLQAAGDWRNYGSMRTKSFGVRTDANLRRGGEARRDIERLERELAGLKRPEAPKAGPVNFDDIKPGGIIKRDGQYYRVTKVNAKSVKVEMPPGWDDVFKKDAKITEVHAPGLKVTKAGAVPEAPKASATTRGRFSRALKGDALSKLDTRRDNPQAGGVSKSPTTEANVSTTPRDKFDDWADQYKGKINAEKRAEMAAEMRASFQKEAGNAEASQASQGVTTTADTLKVNDRIIIGNSHGTVLSTPERHGNTYAVRVRRSDGHEGTVRIPADRELNVERAGSRLHEQQTAGHVEKPKATPEAAREAEHQAAQTARADAYKAAQLADDLTGLSDKQLGDASWHASTVKDQLTFRKINRESVRRMDKKRLSEKAYAAKYPRDVADFKPESWDDIKPGDTVTLNLSSGRATGKGFRVVSIEPLRAHGDNGQRQRVVGYYVNSNGTPNKVLNKTHAPGAPDDKGQELDIHIRNVANVEKNTTGSVTASDVTAQDVPSRTGEMNLGVTESSKGRTTTLTLPDGSTATRTSTTKAYTHAVVVTTDHRGQAVRARKSAAEHDRFAEALQAWIAAGADVSKLEKHRTASQSVLDEREGRSPWEYYLPGFGPVTRERKRSRFGGGGTYKSDENSYSIPDPADKQPLRYSDKGETAYEKYGPEYILKLHRERAASDRAQADKLDAGPAESYHVSRWSQSLNGAMQGQNEASQVPNQRTQIVGVGGVAKAPTKPPAPTAEEKAATRAATLADRKAKEAADRAARNAKFFADKRKSIEDAIRNGRDPEDELKFTTEEGLRSIAREFGVKLPRLPRDSYGRSQPLDRDNARKLIVDKIRGDLGKA